jgi:hypothetical protein
LLSSSKIKNSINPAAKIHKFQIITKRIPPLKRLSVRFRG